MKFSIEESLHFFALIKRFHKRGYTTEPRFENMQLAIDDSLYNPGAVLKPEFSVAQIDQYTPVNFLAWINVVNSIKEEFHIPDLCEPLPPVADILNIFKYTGREHTLFPNFILRGLFDGAGIEMPPAKHDLWRDIKLSRSQLLRASFEKLKDLRSSRKQFIMLFRLILANHFETIPNDVHHPITFQKYNHPNRYRIDQEYYKFLSPPSPAAEIH